MRLPTRCYVAFLALALMAVAAPNATAQEGAGAPADAWGVPSELDMEAVSDYLDAIDYLRLDVEIAVGEGSEGEWPFGPFLAKSGTEIEIRALFEASDPTDPEDPAVIQELKIGPKGGGILSLGPLQLKDQGGKGIVWLDDEGAVCLGLDFEVKLLFKKNFREQICIKSTERTDDGYLEFHSKRQGFLARWVVPEIRISPDGVIEKKGVPFLPWLGDWKPLSKKAPKVPMRPPGHTWPIRLSQVLDWLPQPGEAETAEGGAAPAADPGGGKGEVRLPIGVPRLWLELTSRMKRGEVEFRDPAAKLVFTDHEMHLEIHGGFDDRTFRTSPARESTLVAKWTVEGNAEVPDLGRAEIGRSRIELDGKLTADFPLREIEQRQANVDFGVAVDLDLTALTVSTAEGLALALADGLQGRLAGRGSAGLLPGLDEPVISLTPGSSLEVTIPGPVVVDRPVKTDGPPPVLELPGQLNLRAASDAPLLRLTGGVGSGSTGDPAGEASRNLTVFDVRFELAAVGGDTFGLRTPGGLLASFGPGTGIGLEGELGAAAWLEGLESIHRAALAVNLRAPDDGGPIELRTRKGMQLAGRVLGGSGISISTGTLTAGEGSVIGSGSRDGSIDVDLRLLLGGDDRPSAVTGGARLDLDGSFGLRLDPAQRKAEPRGPLLVGPVPASLSLAIDLAAGSTYRPPDDATPVVFKGPTRFDIGLAGALGPGADPGVLEVSIEQPVGVAVELKPK